MQEILNQLTDTEAEADKLLVESEETAKEIIEKANADGEKLFAETVKNAEDAAAKIIEEAKANAEKLYVGIMEGYDKKCSSLHDSTKKSEQAAVQNILNNLS